MHWLNRFSGYLQRVLSYEDPQHQAKARSLIPIPKLNSQASRRLKEVSASEELQKTNEAVAGAKSKVAKPLDFNVS